MSNKKKNTKDTSNTDNMQDTSNTDNMQDISNTDDVRDVDGANDKSETSDTSNTKYKLTKKSAAIAAVSIVAIALLTIIAVAQPFSNGTPEGTNPPEQITATEHPSSTAEQNKDFQDIIEDLLIDPEEPFYDGSFVLSAMPGFHDEAFDLIVSIPLADDVVIYYTIDGAEPQPGEDRFITRGENSIQVSGRLPESGQIRVEDRSGYWRESILTYHHTDRIRSRPDVRPASGAEILQGTAFRFRGFVDGEPVTETITATYIIAADAGARFAYRPIIAVTAPYEEFIFIYRRTARTATPQNLTAHRRIFNYEYFEYGAGGYMPIFNLQGSTSLGGDVSRNYAQRTFDVLLSRGELDGVVTHSIFPGLHELYGFRLCNGGQSFMWDHMRDPFVHTASSGLTILHEDSNLAIKFINGEFWGFVTMCEDTSSRHFITTRTGVASDNTAILDIEDGSLIGKSASEGSESVVAALYGEFVEFITLHDMSTDYSRERLFNEFLCQDNFMDYLVANTFFNNRGWPNDRMRMFRAITPDPASENPYDDGKWRFVLYSMDAAPRHSARAHAESFSQIYVLLNGEESSVLYGLQRIFLVLNNPTFVEQFRERALYVLDTYFQTDALLALHSELISQYEPLLPEMYNRFAIEGTVEESISNFHRRTRQLADFLSTRGHHYRRQLDELVGRVQ